MELRDYQIKLADNTIRLLPEKKRVVSQLATGGGKSITFGSIASRFLTTGKSVLILVHRIELLKQTRQTLYDAFDINCQIIIAGMRTIPSARVYVGMIESANKRVQHIKDIGLLIIDEAHIAVHNKIHAHFPDAYIIGFTATPLAANRREPMKKYYNDIVCGVDIPELIRYGSLCQNITFAPKDVVDRATLAVKGNDFDEGQMAMKFSKVKYINNTVDAYKKWGDGKKTIIFNVNVSHSKAVCMAFLAAGYDCRHLDGSTPPNERVNILNWFKHTHNTILCNVGIATTGFNEPTIEMVMVNKSTQSMPHWLQMTGRGSRPLDWKKIFFIIDMGSNAVTHGDWGDPRDWTDIFWNPPKPGEGGVAPVKNCPECDAIIPAQCKTCPHCGYEYPPPDIEEETPIDAFVAITKNIDVGKLVADNTHRKEWFPFFDIGTQLSRQAKNTLPFMSDENAAFILSTYHVKAKEWCKIKGKYWTNWHVETSREHLYKELAKQFKTWKNPLAPVQ